jgi:hypothetical protein
MMQIRPSIFLSCIAQGSVLEVFEDLVQGVTLTMDNIDEVAFEIKQKLDALEHKMSKL